MFTMHEGFSSGERRLPRRITQFGGVLALGVLGLAAGLGLPRLLPAPALAPVDLAALYALPLPPPPSPLAVYHVGHSLVGRDMPAMLGQLMDPGYRYDSQIGWGATLRAHWGDDAVAGFAEENAHPRFRPAAEAVDSGDYDAVVLTEMVEIRDAIRYHDSPAYLRRWAARAMAARPGVRVFVYETWHRLDDPEGWLVRLDRDLPRYWQSVLLAQAQADPLPQPIHVIPAGQVMAAFVRALAALGGVDGLTGPADLFADEIHLDDRGAYLVALTHYAVLTQRSPVGLPHRLLRADGTSADAPGPEAARLMQQVVWQVVTRHPETGVPQAAGIREAS